MLKLRTKLVASHILPSLPLMPILSLCLLYSLEGFDPRLVRQLTGQAQLLLDQIEQTPEVAENSQTVESFLAKVARQTDARGTVLSKEGTILASTRAEDADRIGAHYTDQAVELALAALAHHFNQMAARLEEA